MKFATVRDLKNRTSEMIRRAAGTDMLITSHGRPVAILRGVKRADVEDWVLAHDPVLRASIEAADRDFRKHGGIPLDQVIRELNLKIGGGRRKRGGRKRS
jgi:prevent-host-death family protein